MKKILIHLLKPLSFLPAIVMMYLIYSFSAQTGEVSGALSYEVSYQIVETKNELLSENKSYDELAYSASSIEFYVRKAAHMTEYAILGLLSFAFYRGILKKEKRQFLAALLTAAVYAATDEFHQYFIPGRSAEVMDVCIDTLGALIGLAILFFTLKVVRKHCQKSKLTLQ